MREGVRSNTGTATTFIYGVAFTYRVLYVCWDSIVFNEWASVFRAMLGSQETGVESTACSCTHPVLTPKWTGHLSQAMDRH